MQASQSAHDDAFHTGFPWCLLHRDDFGCRAGLDPFLQETAREHPLRRRGDIR